MNNIVIFGAGSAIAQAFGRLMTPQKPNLVLIDRDRRRAEIVAADLKTRGAAAAHPIGADLTKTSEHLRLWLNIRKNMDSIDTVLIAYGTLGDQRAGEANFAVAEKELKTNFLSVVSLLTIIANDLEVAEATVAARKSKQDPPVIAVISSVAGDRGRKSNYIYGTAKGGLSVFLQGLRNRLHGRVHVLTIKPGFVDTPMTAGFKKGRLWVKPDRVARKILEAILRQKNVAYIPWWWRYLMLVIKLIPEPVFKRMNL